MKWVGYGGAAVLFLVLVPLAALMMLVTGAQNLPEEPPPTGPDGPLDPGGLPDGAKKWVEQAGTKCPEVSPALVAAIGETESGWDVDAVSPVGAVGPFQFMPMTWAAFGVDADGDGSADPRSIPDAAVSAGRLLCANADQLKGEGLEATPEHLAAAYNAGAGQVIASGGVPPFAETQIYVVKVRAALERFTKPDPDDEVADPGAAAVIAAAKGEEGTPYAWGGGDYYGPTRGKDTRPNDPNDIWDASHIVGYDCSGLMEFAYYQGTNGRVQLGNDSRDQISDGQSVSRSEMQPGDFVVFTEPSGLPFHVALYAGDGQFVHAPEPGAVVRTEQLAGSPYWESKGWHPRRVI